MHRAKRAALRALACAGLVAALIAPATAAAEDPAAAAREQVKQLEEVIAARPDDANLRYFLALLRLGASDRKGAIAALEDTLRLGDGFLPTADFFAALESEPAYAPLRRGFEERLPRVERGTLYYRATQRDLMPEGVASDGRSLFIASMKDGSIWRIGPDRKARLFARGRGLPRLGLAYDAARRRLCAVTTNGFLDAAAASRRNHVDCFDSRTGSEVQSFAVPGALQLNDLAISPDGQAIYATDSAAGSLWRIDAQGKPHAFADSLPGANGLALDGKGALYVAHNSGIARIDADKGTVLTGRLPVKSRETVAGIDGLYWHEGALIGVQNVTNPGRVIRMTLGTDGAIARVETLQSHHSRWISEPTTAAIAGKRLFLLATSEVSRLQPDGSIRDIATVKPAAILSLAL